MSKRDWRTETIIPGVRVSYEVRRVLASERTACQELVLIENDPFGRVLMLDGAVQTTTADEFIYHEMLSHVPLFSHGRAAHVLIIGGGDCGLAEEVLRHHTVRSVTQVEIDASVVEFSRRRLSEINAPVFLDERFHLHIGDGAAFVSGVQQRFDVVLIDSTDPVGAAKALFTEEFYASVRGCLREGGVVAIQAGAPFVQSAQFAATMRNLQRVFPIAACYLLASPSYFGGRLALGWASESVKPASVSLETLVDRYTAAGLRTRYYTPEMHKSAFVLPPYIRELMSPSH